MQYQGSWLNSCSNAAGTPVKFQINYTLAVSLENSAKPALIFFTRGWHISLPDGLVAAAVADEMPHSPKPLLFSHLQKKKRNVWFFSADAM